MLKTQAGSYALLSLQKIENKLQNKLTSILGVQSHSAGRTHMLYSPPLPIYNCFPLGGGGAIFYNKNYQPHFNRHPARQMFCKGILGP